MQISEAVSVTDTRLKTKNISFEKLAERIREKPIITPEPFDEYQKLRKEARDKMKDVGGFVLGKFKNGKRSNSALINRTGIALDLDKIEGKEDYQNIIETLDTGLCHQYCLYSTRNSTENNPRVRVLFPLLREVDADEYSFIARRLCSILGMEHCDPVSARPSQLMFWPSISSDMKETYDSQYSEELRYPPLDPDEYLDKEGKWRSIENWDKFPEENDLKPLDDNKGQYKDPRTAPGLIGLFNQAYTVPEAIETFLTDIYEPSEKTNRYTYIKGSSTEGGVVYGDEEFGAPVRFYSFHATDPLFETPVDAYDLVRLHLFGDTDKAKKEMRAFVNKDEKVKEIRSKQTLEKMMAHQKEISAETLAEREDKNDWVSELTIDNKGEYEKTYDNLLKIMRNDPNLKDHYYYDEFAVRPKVSKRLPWAGNYRTLPRNWGDDDVIGMMSYLETTYNMYQREKIKDACRLSSKERIRHPVREYLESLEWDGIPRLDTLLIDYFGAEDNPYTREAIHKALVAAVARVEEPGIKFDCMLILIGSQGIGKSTFLDILGKDWFTDSYIDFSNKEGYQMLQGNWIIEIGELTGFYKKEVEQIKSFLSKREDEYRAPYDKYVENHPRQCVIFGTTNSKTFLRDQTGNRRFWPIQLETQQPIKNVFEDLPEELDQIWAEAYYCYKQGEELKLSDESEKLAKKAQEDNLIEDPKRDAILSFLAKEVPVDWHSKSIEERRAYWSGGDLTDADFDGEPVKTVKRKGVAAVELWCELFGHNRSDFGQVDANIINRILDTFPGLVKTRSTIFGKAYGSVHGYKINEDFYHFYQEVNGDKN